VPLEVYFKGGWAKIRLGLGKGRRIGDHREEIRREEDAREAREAVGKGRGR
jgi:SsrA-binding protein